MDAMYVVDVSYMVYIGENEVDFEQACEQEMVFKSKQEAKDAARAYDLKQHKNGLVDRVTRFAVGKGRVAADVVTVEDGDITDTIVIKSLSCTMEHGKPVWVEK